VFTRAEWARPNKFDTPRVGYENRNFVRLNSRGEQEMAQQDTREGPLGGENSDAAPKLPRAKLKKE
jgi:hypothetical protein